jgi:ankyrin repeat protein
MRIKIFATAAAGITVMLLGAVPARAADVPLSIGYELPTNSDLAGDALSLESKCLNSRETVNQACSNGANQSGCMQQAEISFRRCISGIPGTKFWLAAKASPNASHVDLVFPLTADEAIEPELNPVLNQLRSANRYSPTGVYAQVEKESCALRRSSDNGDAAYGNGYLCQALQDVFFNQYEMPVAASKGIPLLVAITRNHSSLAWALLERGALSEASSSLAAACANSIKSPDNWRSMIRLLVNHGLDVNAVIPVMGQSTLLDTAVGRNDMEMVRYLLEKGADLDKGTPLSIAVAGSNAELVKLLIKKGADVNEMNGTPLALVAGKGNLALVKLLVANGAKPDAYPSFSVFLMNGAPALIEAVKGKHLTVVKWLLEHGASVNIPDRTVPGRETNELNHAYAYDRVNIMGWPAMLHAIQSGNLDMVKLLLAHKAYIGKKGDRVSGPMWWAVRSGNVGIAKFLLSHGADVNECVAVTTMCNPTPLQEASRSGNLEMVKLLVKLGADVNGEGSAIGASPVWVANTCHHPDLSEFLKKHGGAWAVRLTFEPENFRCE